MIQIGKWVINSGTVPKISSGTALPVSGVDNEVFVKTNTNIIYNWNGGAWHATGGGGSFAGMVEALDFQDINNAIATNTYTIELVAQYGYTINSVDIISGAGTGTVSFKKNGVNITGLGAIAVSNVLTTAIASGLNVVTAGQKITMVLTVPVGLNNLQFTMKTTRT